MPRAVDGRYFHNLQDDEQEQILSYPLQVYVCEGTASEKLAWFRIINIAGEKLTAQELRNAVYAGPWVSDAKRYFSRKGAACPAYAIGSRYVKGRADRQEYLEIAIQWIKDEGQTVEEYMAFASHVRRSLRCRIWRPTTSPLGPRAARQSHRTVKCCASIAIAGNPTSEAQGQWKAGRNSVSVKNRPEVEILT